ncbi:MAG: porin family protein [Ginsengibacter sp.]
MKRIIIFILSGFIFFTADAQKTHFGIKGGLNASSLHFGDNTSLDSKIGFHVGGLAHIHASKTWAIQPEIFYSLEGAKGTLPNNNKLTYNLNYINVPVLLQYFFYNGFRLEGGPQIGFLISAKTKTGNITVDDKGFESTAFSIPLGVGYLTTEGLGFDARYVFGLSNINANKNAPTIQSNVFQFGIFYQFGDTKMRRH